MRKRSLRVIVRAVCGTVPFLASALVSAQTSNTASRIVTLGGSITEIVFELGYGKQVVGVDQSSHVPALVEKLPKVGVFRSVPAEGVLALSPTIVLGTTDAGPATSLEQLRSAGVTVKLVPVAESVEGALVKIRAVADALGVANKGAVLATRVSAQIDSAKTWAARAKTQPRTLFIYARGGGTLLVAGTKTAAESMIKLANGKNAITAFEGFRPLTAEAVVAAAPDVIVIPNRGLEAVGGVAGLLKLPGIALTPAGKARRVVAIDDEMLMGFGPRLGAAVRALSAGLHPELRAR